MQGLGTWAGHCPLSCRSTAAATGRLKVCDSPATLLLLCDTAWTTKNWNTTEEAVSRPASPPLTLLPVAPACPTSPPAATSPSQVSKLLQLKLCGSADTRLSIPQQNSRGCAAIKFSACLSCRRVRRPAWRATAAARVAAPAARAPPAPPRAPLPPALLCGPAPRCAR